MLKINPGTNFLNLEFKNNDIIYLNDHMPYSQEIRISIKGVDCYFKNTIIDLFEQKNINYENKKIISDHYLIFEDFKNFNIDVNSNIFIKMANMFFNGVGHLVPDEVKYKFTFMSNKARHHRTLCATVIANLFDKNDISYSYNSGLNDSLISSELLLKTDYNFDTEKILPDQWYDFKSGGKLPDGYGSTSERFVFLWETMYKNSATSIITEPCFFERGNIITEKTLMSIYSNHFMIWPGAWKLPETVKKLGIDVFDDVIDHSYQYIEHPGKRVVEAFLRNKPFLDNIELQQKNRDKCRDRLQHNLNLVRDLPTLKKYLSQL